MKKLLIVASAALSVSLSAPAQGVIADWTFETSVPTTAGPYSPENGTGTATGSHASTSVYSNPAGNGSAHSYSSTVWAVGDYYQFEVSTIGITTALSLSFDQTSSGTGPGSFQLQYSLTGVNGSFVNIGSAYTVLDNGLSPNASWNATTYNAAYTITPDLSALTATLDNQATVYLRLSDASTVSSAGGTVATTGTDRVDNFDLTYLTSTPEPSTLALAGVGVASLFLARRRSK